jgi:hypothetical protein
MKIAHIERLVGQEAIADLQCTVASVLAASGGDHGTVCALREFLVGLLASILTTRTYLPQSQRLAAEDAALLNALVRKIKDITPHQAATPMTARVIELARRGVRPVAGETQSHEVVPFRDSGRVPGGREAESVAGRDFMSHVAGVSAAKRAIARKQELSAQKREVLARSQALLAHSRSLRASLEATQSGRHF